MTPSTLRVIVTGAEWRLRVLTIAAPMILVNLSQPFMTFVGMTIAGHLPTPAYLAGVTLGGTLLNLIYWLFLFLRMSVTGLVAQSRGAGDYAAARDSLLRGLAIASLCGAVLTFSSYFLVTYLLPFLGGAEDVQEKAAHYSVLRLYSAPAALMNYVIVGYLVGSERAFAALLLQSSINLLNAGIAYYLAFHQDLGITGIALGAFSADWAGVLLGLALIARKGFANLPPVSLRVLTNRSEIKLLMTLNRDLLIRNLALMVSQFLIIRASATQGTSILAANAILLNLNLLVAHAIDGFSYAAQTLVGAAIGARNAHMLRATTRSVFLMGGVLACLFTVLFALLGPQIINLMTEHQTVREDARRYLIWLILLPPLAMWSFVLDGIFIGAIRAREARNAIVLSVLGFCLAVFTLPHLWGNDGLWASFVLLMVFRALTLGTIWARLSPKQRLTGPVRRRPTSQSPTASMTEY